MRKSKVREVESGIRCVGWGEAASQGMGLETLEQDSKWDVQRVGQENRRGERPYCMQDANGVGR